MGCQSDTIPFRPCGLPNSGGGLIVIPGSTREDANGEVIDKVGDLSLDLIDTTQIRAILAAWVYPLIEGLEVRVVETSGARGRLLIHVPPQRAETWPHIVTRGPVGERVSTNLLGICVREGADVHTLDAATIHGLLSAGRRASSPATQTGQPPSP